MRPYPYEPDDPVICEIAEPEDWAELVNRHPLVRKRDPDFWEYWLGAQGGVIASKQHSRSAGV
ncbi:hypothetical protein [Propionibacterium freudenreichii]|uniref:hypothetical protein n=1 Tax=Propionibacterium freudenreichii TaxID=1744 RepID=UPI0021A34CA6|nr:hypothetical protein [Propionibacterium freudenreichii]